MSEASFTSIATFLPLQFREGSLRWMSSAEYALKAVARGPQTSQVTNAGALIDFIDDVRFEIGDLRRLPLKSGVGLSIFCDEVSNAHEFFTSTLPAIAKLAVELPALLEHHEKEIRNLPIAVPEPLAFRILSPQKPGLVLLHQHLIAALLACAFFCLYPEKKERWKCGLVNINFDGLYLGIAYGVRSNVQKLLCLIHYFERVGANMPQGTVSFERKVLSLSGPTSVSSLSAPNESLWSESKKSLCGVKVVENGAIEESGPDFLQVDFANQQLGGGVLQTGCVQEEIRFAISPECIAGILFISTMDDNESIEIIGAETYSQYTGYGTSFCFARDHIDNTCRDFLGRRKTCISAIDALNRPGEDQFKDKLMIRELNKAYCGFLNHSTFCGFNGLHNVIKAGGDFFDVQDCQDSGPHKIHAKGSCVVHETLIGVATGNWGAGAFGGNLHLKSLLQWLAASQAGCSKMLYYSFSDVRAQRFQEVVDWIQNEDWSVSELWSLLQQYGHLRIIGQVDCELYDWILPPEESSSS